MGRGNLHFRGFHDKRRSIEKDFYIEDITLVDTQLNFEYFHTDSHKHPYFP